MTDRLFVYGTLAPGRPNEHVLEAVPGIWTPAVVTGDLIEQGWGASMGYPAIVLRADGPEVSGFVFTSDALADHWSDLDQFEGPGYERVVVRAVLANGETVSAYVYVAKV